MEGKYKLREITSAVFLFLLLAIPGAGQSILSSDQPALLEVVHTSCLTPDCGESYTWRVYANGNVVVESNTLDRTKTGRSRKILHREETQLDPEELAEFAQLTEKADFLNASPEYVVKRMIESSSWVTIIYRKDKLEKRVRIYNYLIASDLEKTKLPPSVLKILKLSSAVP